MKIREHEVVVVGGGTAGAIAAIASARNNADTLLVERYGFLGGTMTAGHMNIALGFHTLKGEMVIRGIAEELAEEVTKQGGGIGIKMRPNLFFSRGPAKAISGYSQFWYDPEVMKKVLQDMAVGSGVKLLLHSMAVDSITQEGTVKGVIVENKSGREVILAKVVIDATADGDVATRAGAKWEMGGAAEYFLKKLGEGMPSDKSRGALTPLTLMFSVANIDEDKLRQFVKENPKQFRSKWDAPKLSVAVREFGNWEKAVKEGELSQELDPVHCSFGLWPTQKGIATFNATRIMFADGTNVDDLTRAEITARNQAWMILNFCKKYMPGFETAFMMVTATQTEPRETRRIMGDYIMTEEDILQGRKFDDVVAKGATNLDIHSPLPGGGEDHLDIAEGGSYDIPYRALLSAGLEGIMVVGRCMSGTVLAFTSLKFEPVCMSTGQAAGIAAALAVREDVKPRNLDIKLLQKTLMEQGQVLHSLE